MDKTAQERKLKHKMQEFGPGSFSPKAIKKYFNPEHKRILDALKKADNNIRSIALGKDVKDGILGNDEFNGKPGKYMISFKDLLKAAQTNLNRREYMAFVSDMGKFHNKMEEIKAQLETIQNNVEQTTHEFLFKDMGEDNKGVLKDLHEKFSKSAGIVDFLANISSKRGRALMAYEANYPHIVEKIKNQSNVVLSEARKIYDLLLASLDAMAGSRATGNVDDYKTHGENLIKKYEKWNELFKKYYKDEVASFIIKAKLFEKQDEAKQQQQESLPTPPSNSPSPSPIEPGPSFTPPNAPMPPRASIPLPPQPKLPGMEKLSPQSPLRLNPSALQNIPQELKDKAVNDNNTRVTAMHNKFFETLESMAGESPIVLKSYINKYARLIQDKDLETAIKLFNISKSI